MFLKTVLILRIFTSHYVSINSIFTLTKVRPPMAFTSHYVSINSEQSQDELFTSKIFTSHYVSINSSRRNASIFELANLHPTMYLLIRQIQSRLMLFSLYLHPTMYLLIQYNNRNRWGNCYRIYIPLCIY